jgi:hypothetical protein
VLVETGLTASIPMRTTWAFCGLANVGSSASDSVQQLFGA